MKREDARKLEVELFGSVSTSLVRLGYGVSPSSRVRSTLPVGMQALLTYLLIRGMALRATRLSPFFPPALPSVKSRFDLIGLDMTDVKKCSLRRFWHTVINSAIHRCGCDCRTSPIRRRLLPAVGQHERQSKQPTESDSTLKLRPSKRCERRHGFSGRPLVSLSLNRCSVLNESQIAKSQLRRMIAKTAVTMLRAKLGREFAHR